MWNRRPWTPFMDWVHGLGPWWTPVSNPQYSYALYLLWTFELVSSLHFWHGRGLIPYKLKIISGVYKTWARQWPTLNCIFLAKEESSVSSTVRAIGVTFFFLWDLSPGSPWRYFSRRVQQHLPEMSEGWEQCLTVFRWLLCCEQCIDEIDINIPLPGISGCLGRMREILTTCHTVAWTYIFYPPRTQKNIGVPRAFPSQFQRKKVVLLILGHVDGKWWLPGKTDRQCEQVS